MGSQLKDFAFTVKRHAYKLDNKLLNRRSPVFITANSGTSKDWRERIRVIDQDSAIGDVDEEAEAKMPEECQARSIWVGVVPVKCPSPRQLNDEHGRGTVGVSKPTAYTHPVNGKSPFRVVARLNPNMLTGPVRMFVLTNQDAETKLWNPHSISHDHVFFFYEYRNTASNVADRRQGWVHKIIMVALPEALKNNPDRYVGPEHRGDQTSITMAELHGLFGELNMQQTTSSLERIVHRVKQDESIAARPLHSAMIQFITLHGRGSCNLTAEDAERFATLFHRMWPQFTELVTGARLHELHKAIEKEKPVVGVGHVYLFIVYGCQKLQEDNDTTSNVVTDALSFKGMRFS